LQKAIINFVMSVCPSFCPYTATQLPLERMSLILTPEYFSKICGENSRFIKVAQE